LFSQPGDVKEDARPSDAASKAVPAKLEDVDFKLDSLTALVNEQLQQATIKRHFGLRLNQFVR